MTSKKKNSSDKKQNIKGKPVKTVLSENLKRMFSKSSQNKIGKSPSKQSPKNENEVQVSFKTKSGKIVKFQAKKPEKSRIKTKKPYGYN